jgi:hypothetical protein
MANLNMKILGYKSLIRWCKEKFWFGVINRFWWWGITI